MIQFSFLPGDVPANPTKAALPAAVAGLFAGMLEGEIGQEPQSTGKDLPEGGKELPAVAAPIALPLPVKLLARLGATMATAKPEPLPVDEHGTMPVRDSDEGPAEDIVAPAKFFLDPIIPFAAPPPPTSLPEATAQDAETLPTRRAAPPLFAANRPEQAVAKPQVQPIEQTAKPLPVLPTIEVPQIMAEQAVDPRIAKVMGLARPAASREFQIELGNGARPLPALKLAEALVADKQPAALTPAAAAVTASIDTTATAPTPTVARLADADGIARPHDFSALVDRLVEARNAMTPHEATMTVKHAEFGDVSLRFSHQDGALSVSMTSQDPDFDRAVNAAMPAERGQSDTNGQAGTQGNRRDDAMSRAAANADASAQNGNARRGHDASGDEIDQNNPGQAARKSSGGQGGIFA